MANDANKLVTRDDYTYKASTAKVTVFPQEYFSGCDVSVNIEGEKITDILNLNFSLQEQVRPLYGYSSRVYDDLAVGNRLVVGSFAVAFSKSKKMKEMIKAADLKVKARMPQALVAEIKANSAVISATQEGVYQTMNAFGLSAYSVSNALGIDMSSIGYEWEAQTDARKAVVRQAMIMLEEGSLITKGHLPWPLKGTLTSAYGKRIDPITGVVKMHKGIDISGPHHADIKSVASGKVVQAGLNGDYGNFIRIEHTDKGKKFYSAYGHLYAMYVKVGDTVYATQSIGLQGGAKGETGAGRSTGKHLHFEIRDSNNTQVSPVDWLSAKESLKMISSTEFVKTAFAIANVGVPNLPDTIAKLKTTPNTALFKTKSSLLPGDMAFTKSSTVGIYVGANKVITSSMTKGIYMEELNKEYTEYLRVAALGPDSKDYKDVIEDMNKYNTPQLNSLSMDYREVDRCRGHEKWRSRFNSRNIVTDSVGNSVINSSEFAYEPAGKDLNIESVNMKFKSLKFMPIDKINKIVLYHSIKYPINIEDIHNEMTAQNKQGVGVHFLIKKNGTVQCGMPICFSIENDAAIHIMLEGCFDKGVFNRLESITPENKPPTADQMDSLYTLIKDIMAQTPSLKSIYAYREYLVSNKGKSIEDETSPGVLFPMLKIGEDLGLNRPTDIAHKFFNRYLDIYGAEDLDDLIPEEAMPEETVEDQNMFSISAQDIDGPNVASYSPDYVVLIGEGASVGSAVNVLGTMSYGNYQFIAAGELPGFMNYLKQNNKTIYGMLAGENTKAYYNSTNFQKKWKEVAKVNPVGFAKEQFNYSYKVTCLANANKLPAPANKYKNNIATLNAIWSTANQCGNGGYGGIIKRTIANHYDKVNQSEASFLTAFYSEKANYFRESTSWPAQTIKSEITRRVENELKMLQKMINGKIDISFATSATDPGGGGSSGGTGSPTSGEKFDWTTYADFSKSNIKSVQTVLNVLYPTIVVDGSFGPASTTALRKFEKEFNNSKSLMAKPYKMTKAEYDAFYAELGMHTITKSGRMYVVNPGAYGTGGASSQQYSDTSGASISALVDTFWNVDDVESKKNGAEAYFYDDSTPHAQLAGIDISIQYGYEYNGKEYFKQYEKLKNVQIRSVSKQVDPSGEVIAEVYEFIARDLE